MPKFIPTSLLGLFPVALWGCGLDWTLPQAHFEGVDEHGYVSYWEKIGEADLGDGLVIPVNINFNSHRESNSPSLGKGWTVALLESHVEPVDENCMRVMMPDGWMFTFFRNGNSEIWRGNAGWVGETKDTVFTATAPCGWRVKFDQGKIQEIDTNKNRILTYKYNGPVAVEVDEGNKAFVKLEGGSSTGVATDIMIGEQKVDITLAQRPRVQTMLKQNLVTGFDASLSGLQMTDGKQGSFSFGTDKGLNPTLTITHSDQAQRNLSWDAATRQIKTDGEWTYTIIGNTIGCLGKDGYKKSLFTDNSNGIQIEIAGNTTLERRWFTSGLMTGLERNEVRKEGGLVTYERRCYYNERGQKIRESTNGIIKQYTYNSSGQLAQILINGALIKSYAYQGNKLIAITQN